MSEQTLVNKLLIAFTRIFQGVIRVFTSKKFYWKFFPRFIETLDLIYEAPVGEKTVRFYCNGELARWRAENLLTEEPETIAWIDDFQPDDVLLDIGANIGAYTLYAAAVRGIRVIAIEPSTENFATLCRNIRENYVSHLVYPFCVAANDCEEVMTLFMHYGALAAGGSGAVFGTDRLGDNEILEVKGKQHTVGFSMDNLIKVFNVPFPTQMKMDVLGTQDKVIKGARGLLNDPRLRSAMIEIMVPDQKEQSVYIFDEVKKAGFVQDKLVGDTDFFFSRLGDNMTK